jgi:hypothetical protein
MSNVVKPSQSHFIYLEISTMESIRTPPTYAYIHIIFSFYTFEELKWDEVPILIFKVLPIYRFEEWDFVPFQIFNGLNHFQQIIILYKNERFKCAKV